MGKGWAVLSLPYLQTIWMICIHSMCLTAMETQPAKVFDAAGNAKTADVYRISGGKLTTDYLRSDYSDCSRIAYGSWCSGDDQEETNSGKEIRFL